MSSVFLVFINVVIALLNLDLGELDKDTYAAIQNRQGFLFIIAIMIFFTGVNSTGLSLLPKKKIYVKDRHSRTYSSFAFYMAQQFFNLPLFLPIMFLVILMFYFMNQLNTYPNHWNIGLFYYFYVVGAFFGGSSLGFVISSIANSVETVSALIPLFVLPFMLVNGFFANLKTSNWFIRIFSYTSIPRFFYQGLTLVEFQNHEEYKEKCSLPFPCTLPSGESGTCERKVNSPLCDPLQTADYYEQEIWENMVAVAVIGMFFRILGFVLFVTLNKAKALKEIPNEQIEKSVRQYYESLPQKLTDLKSLSNNQQEFEE